MAAGLGFIEFTTGDVLSAAAANGYLASQTVMVFADAAARTSAITSPQEGMFSFLKNTNATQFYDGAAWVNLDTTGMVNPMTTTGDVIYSSSGTTPARLGIGTAGQVLTVNSGADAPEWANAAAGGGLTLLSTTTLSGASTTVSSISGSYKNLILFMKELVGSNDSGQVLMRLNGITTSLYSYGTVRNIDNTVSANTAVTDTKWQVIDRLPSSAGVLTRANGVIKIYRYTDTDFVYGEWQSNGANSNGTQVTNSVATGKFDNTAAISSVTLFPDSGTLTGTLYIYGEN
jgi:hypothetical protein